MSWLSSLMVISAYAWALLFGLVFTLGSASMFSNARKIWGTRALSARVVLPFFFAGGLSILYFTIAAIISDLSNA